MLKNLEQLKQRILEKRKDLTKEELNRLIEDKKRSYSGFLSDEGAIRLIGQELLVQFNEGQVLSEVLPIEKLTQGLNNVNVAGRIIVAWPPKDFVREDKTSGSVTRLVLADKTGMITCVAWDHHKTALTKPNALKSKLVQINHAYTRVGLGEELELHIGSRGSISISPTELESRKYPGIEELFLNVSELNEKNIRVNIRVIAKSEPTTSKFLKRDGEGLLCKIRAADRTGEITVVAWNAEAENLSRLSVGDTLEILNGKVKEGLNKVLEIHVTKSSVVTFRRKDASKQNFTNSN